MGIKKIPFSKIYCDLQNESRSVGETNDCAVKAVAILCGVPYSKAHATLKGLGRKDRHGTYPVQTHDAIGLLGKKLVRLNQRDFIDPLPERHRTMRSVTTHHPRRFPEMWDKSKRYLLHVRGHVLAVIDGQVQDWSVNTSKRVLSIHEVI